MKKSKVKRKCYTVSTVLTALSNSLFSANVLLNRFSMFISYFAANTESISRSQQGQAPFYEINEYQFKERRWCLLLLGSVCII